MKHRNRIPLNLQYFAESTGGEGTGGTGGEGTGDAGGTGAGIDYSKIQSMIDKGTQQKEKAILKSYFEQQGLTGDEMETAIAQFKESKASEAKKQQDDIANMQKENETLKAQILQGKVDAETVRIAGELNVTPANVPMFRN